MEEAPLACPVPQEDHQDRAVKAAKVCSPSDAVCSTKAGQVQREPQGNRAMVPSASVDPRPSNETVSGAIPEVGVAVACATGG